MTVYQYKVLNYPGESELNDYGKEGWKVYHVRPDSGGVPWFVYLMRQVPSADTSTRKAMNDIHAILDRDGGMVTTENVGAILTRAAAGCGDIAKMQAVIAAVASERAN